MIIFLDFDTRAGNKEQACKKPAIICADTHSQLGTHMLGVRVTTAYSHAQSEGNMDAVYWV